MRCEGMSAFCLFLQIADISERCVKKAAGLQMNRIPELRLIFEVE